MAGPLVSCVFPLDLAPLDALLTRHSQCFLTIPAVVYLIMTPRFARTRKFAQPHAMLVVDGLFVVIWLSAFATQAAYNSADQCGKACSLSKAIVALGVFNTYVAALFNNLQPVKSNRNSLLFGGTAFISAYSLTYYNFHGSLPGYDARKIRGGGENIDPDKAAFSMAPHDEEAYERVNMDDHEAHGAGGAYENPAGGYGSGNPYSADDDDPNRYGALPPRTNPLFDSETEYNSGAAVSPPAAYGSRPTYDDEPAQFPSGNYDRVTR